VLGGVGVVGTELLVVRVGTGNGALSTVDGSPADRPRRSVRYFRFDVSVG